MFQRYGIVFAILAFVVSIGILYYYPQVPRKEWLIRLALAMMLGGAVGNLVDRLTIGTVTDFLSVGTFAVFNVADACISVGTALLILAVWISERKQKALSKAAQEQSISPVDQVTSEDHPLE